MRSLAYRIGLGYLLLTTITVAVGAYATLRFAELGGAVGRVMEENYRSVRAAENMLEELERQEAFLARAQGGEAGAQAAFEARPAEFLRWYGEAQAGAALPEEPALLDSIGRAYAGFTAAADSLFVRLEAGRPTAAFAEATVGPSAARLRALNYRLLDLNHTGMLATRARVEREARAATWAVLVAAGLAALASLMAALAFARSVTLPLRRLTESVRRVRRGHLNERVAVTTEDEVGELERAFNEMTARLSAYEALNVEALTAEKDRAEAERERAEAERERAHGERRTAESLVAAMPSPVIVTDEAGHIVLLNRAACDLVGAGAAPSDGEGRALADVAPELARWLDVSDTEGEDALLDMPLGGGARTFRPRRTLVHGAEDVVLRIALLEDVTPFQALERARREFVATVSHELRTPLTSLGVALDLLLKDLVGPLTPAQRDLVETAKADQDRLKRLVADLVALARLEAGEAPARGAVDLTAVAVQALDGLRLPAQEAGVRLETAFEGALRVSGDAQQLGWLVTNLVGNAVRHAPPDTAVIVRGRLEGERVRVEVEDAGAGVPPEDAERIFEPFVQVDTGEHRPGSAGLGLAIARRVVEAHGGRIWAEPHPGRGLFVVTLPLHPPD